MGPWPHSASSSRQTGSNFRAVLRSNTTRNRTTSDHGPNRRRYCNCNWHWNHNRNRHPLAPAGCKMIACENPNVRPTWAEHGVEGFYIGPSPDHYRSHLCCIPTTGNTRVSDTVAFFPNFQMPQETTTDGLKHAIEKIKHLLTSPTPHQPQTAGEALKELKQLFNIDTDLGQRVNNKQQKPKTKKH